MKLNKIAAYLILIIFCLISCAAVYADTDTSIIMQGNYVQTAVSTNGTLGYGGNTEPGIKHDINGTGDFDNIVDDYLTPANPWEMFSVRADQTDLTVNNNNSDPSGQITKSSLTNLSSTSSYDHFVNWTGVYSDYFEISHDYYFNDGDEYIGITTTITALSNLTNVKFARAIDPDPDVYTYDSYDTINGRGTADIAPEDWVHSEGPLTGLTLGLYSDSAITHNTGVSSGWSDDPVYYLSGPDDGDYDYTIGIAFDIGDLAAGESVSITYYYIMGDSLEDIKLPTNRIWDMQDYREKNTNTEILFSGSDNGNLLDLRIGTQDASGNITSFKPGTNPFAGLGNIWELENFGDNNDLYMGAGNQLYKPSVTIDADKVNVALNSPIWNIGSAGSEGEIISMLATNSRLLIGTGTEASTSTSSSSQVGKVFSSDGQLTSGQLVCTDTDDTANRKIVSSGIQCLIESDGKDWASDEEISLVIAAHIEQGGVIDPLNTGEIIPVDSGADEVEYEIEYDASELIDTTNMVLIAPLPAGTKFVSASGNGVYDDQTKKIIWHDVTNGPYIFQLILDKDTSIPGTNLKLLCWVENEKYVKSATDDSVHLGCWGHDILYVKRSNTNIQQDGLSWQTAFSNLSNALNHAKSSLCEYKEVWVAEGIYNVGTSEISIPDGLELYGGFKGNEQFREQRNAAQNETVILGGDTCAFTIADTSSDDRAIINGFTIGGSLAQGIIIESGSPVIANCIIVVNEDAGIRCGGTSTPTIINCIIAENNGDGIFVASTATAEIRNDTIANNSGYGVNNTNATSLTIPNCIIWNNSSGVQVGCTLNHYYADAADPFDPLNPYHLSSAATSCIDQGLNDDITDNTEIDIDGEPRIIGSAVDIGADEFPPYSVNVGEYPPIALSPVSFADEPQTVSAQIRLSAASIFTHGTPIPENVTFTWSKLDDTDPRPVTFDTSASQLNAIATFSQIGLYWLKLEAYSGETQLGYGIGAVQVNMGVDVIPYLADRGTPVTEIVFNDQLTQLSLNARLAPSTVPSGIDLNWYAPYTTAHIDDTSDRDTTITFDQPGWYWIGLEAIDHATEDLIGFDYELIKVSSPDVTISAGPDKTIYLAKETSGQWQANLPLTGSVTGITPIRVEWTVEAADDKADVSTVTFGPENSSTTTVNPTTAKFGHYGVYYVLFKAWTKTPQGEVFLGTGAATITVTYPRTTVYAGGKINVQAAAAPVTVNLAGELTEGYVDSFEWRSDPEIPAGMVNIINRYNNNTPVIFSAVNVGDTHYNGGGKFIFVLLGKINIDGQEFIVAEDSVEVDVAVDTPGEEPQLLEIIPSCAAQNPDDKELPIFFNLGAQIKLGGAIFTNYTSAVWSWEGSDGSIQITQNNSVNPQASVQVNKEGSYKLTLTVKNNEDLIGVASIDLQVYGHEQLVLDAGQDITINSDLESLTSPLEIALAGKVVSGDTSGLEIKWILNTDDLDAKNMVTVLSTTNGNLVNGTMSVDAYGDYSGAGTYPIALVAIKEGKVIAADIIDVTVNLAPGGTVYEQEFTIAPRTDCPVGKVDLTSPIAFNVWADIKDKNGDAFTDFDNFNWSWSGSGTAVIIGNPSVGKPAAKSITINSAGTYDLTLSLFKDSVRIGTASIEVTITEETVTAKAGFNSDWSGKLKTDVGLEQAVLLYGKIENSSSLSVKHFWECSGTQGSYDLQVLNSDATTSNAQVIFHRPGSYGLTFRAVDNSTGEQLSYETIVANVGSQGYMLSVAPIESQVITGAPIEVPLVANIIGTIPTGCSAQVQWAELQDYDNVSISTSGSTVKAIFTAETTPGPYYLKVTGPTGCGTENALTLTVPVYIGQQPSEITWFAGSHQTVAAGTPAYMSDALFISSDSDIVPKWSVVSPAGAQVSFLPNEYTEKPYVIANAPDRYTLSIEPWRKSTNGKLNADQELSTVIIDFTSGSGSDLPQVTFSLQGPTNGKLTITADATDDEGVTGLQLKLGSNILKTVSGAPSYPSGSEKLVLTYDIDISQLPSSVTFTATAWDISANQGQASQTYDNSGGVIRSFDVSPETVSGGSIAFTAAFDTSRIWKLDILRKSDNTSPVTPSPTGSGSASMTQNYASTTSWSNGSYRAVLTAFQADGITPAAVGEVSFTVLNGSITSQPIAELEQFDTTSLVLGTDVDKPQVPVIKSGQGHIYAKAGHALFPDDCEYNLQICTGEKWELYPIKTITPYPHDASGWAVKSSNGQDTVDLGLVDLSTLDNGVYYLQLTVRCRQQIVSDYVQFILDCPLKIGNLKFSQEDLAIETGGIPLRVIRTYDSFQKDTNGEFGFGWTYSIANLDLQLDESRITMSESELHGGSGSESVRFGGDLSNRNVTLTLPDGRRTTFMFYLKYHGFNPDNAQMPYYTAEYEPMPGVDAKLRTLDEEKCAIDASNHNNSSWMPIAHESDAANNPSMYDFSGYVLTAGDGTEYYFERALKNGDIDGGGLYSFQGQWVPVFWTKVYGPPYLTKIRRPSGEQIVLNTNLNNGQIGSTAPIQYKDAAGNTVKTLKVEYESGRIKRIYAPDDVADNIPTVNYVYTNGDLTGVERLTTKGANYTSSIYQKTYYVYGNPSSAHLVTDIKDDRGITPVRYEYDSAGRLTATIDARGNRIEISHDITGKVETTTDRTGNVTVYAYDERGRVTSETRTLDDRELTTSYTYDKYSFGGGNDVLNADSNNPCIVEDSAGNKTYYQYDILGRPTLVIDPESNVTATTYDGNGNVLTVKQGKNYHWNEINEKYEYDSVSITKNTYENDKLKTTQSGSTAVNAEGQIDIDQILSMAVNVYDSLGRTARSINVNVEGTDFAPLYALTIAGADALDHTKHAITSYEYPGSSQQPSAVTDPAGAKTYYHYNGNGNQDASWYNWDDPTTPAEDYTHVVTINEFDSQGRIIKTRRITGSGRITDTASTVIKGYIDGTDGTILTKTAYNSTGKVDTSTDQFGSVTKNWYDEMGNIVQVDTYLESVPSTILTCTKTVYDAEGRVLVTVGPYDPEVYEADPVTLKYDATKWPMATENVYNALGGVEKVRTWVNAANINFVDFKNSSGIVVGKKLTVGITAQQAWDPSEHSGQLPPAGTNIGWFVWNSTQQKVLVPITGNETSYSRTIYDVAGRVSMSIQLDEEGYEQPTGYKYDKAGKQTAIADATDYGLNKLTQYAAIGKWHKITDAALGAILEDGYIDTLNNVSSTQYDGGRRWKVTDDRANTTQFEYDALGRIKWTEYPATTKAALSMNPETFVHIRYDGLGKKKFESDQVIDSVVSISTIGKYFEYDTAGRLTAVVLPKVKDPESADPDFQNNPKTYSRTEYQYDIYGNLTCIIDKIRQYRLRTDPQFDEMTDIIKTASRQTKFTYNKLHNKSSRTLYSGTSEQQTESWEYDAANDRLAAHIDFRGKVEGYEYDGLGRLWHKRYYGSRDDWSSNPSSSWYIQFEYSYDNLGHQIEVTESDRANTYSRTTSYTYDADGKVKEVISPDYKAITYTYSSVTGRKIATISENTNANYTYDSLGRLETVTKPIDDSTPNEAVKYGYDPVGNRDWATVETTGDTNYELKTEYVYDQLNRLTKLNNFKAGHVQLSMFDYTLQNNGQRGSVGETLGSAGHTNTYNYDDLRRLTLDQSLNDGTQGYSANYKLDIVGNRKARTVSANGNTLTTTYEYYNGSDKLKKEIHDGGAVCAYPHGDDTYYAYAGIGGGTNIYYRNSSGDKIGACMAFLKGLPSPWSQPMLLTALVLCMMFLLGPAGAEFARAFWYRKKLYAHIRWRMPRTGLCYLLVFVMLLGPECFTELAQADIAYDQLTTCTWAKGGTTVEYQYDANGSVTQKLTKQGATVIENIDYYYDLAGRLWQIRTFRGGTTEYTTYVYDHQGSRISAENVNSNKVTEYLVDKFNHTGYAQTLEECTKVSGTQTKLITYLIGDDVLAQTTTDTGNTSTKWLLYDGHGSTRQLADAAGTVSSSYSYDAYGIMLGGNPTSASPAATNLLYSGEHFDNSMGEYYLRARWYDQNNGRFNSLDPFEGNNADPQSLHKYLYCHADPVNGVDPSGQFGDFSLSGLMISMSISGIINASIGFYSGERSVGQVATNLIVGFLEGAVFYGAGLAIMKLAAKLIQFGRVAYLTARLTAAMEKTFSLISEAGPKIPGLSRIPLRFVLKTRELGKVFISSGMDDAGKVTGALKHIVNEKLLISGASATTAGATDLAQAIAIRELETAISKAAVEGIKYETKMIVRTGAAEWELMFENTGGIPKLFHAVPHWF